MPAPPPHPSGADAPAVPASPLDADPLVPTGSASGIPEARLLSVTRSLLILSLVVAGGVLVVHLVRYGRMLPSSWGVAATIPCIIWLLLVAARGRARLAAFGLCLLFHLVLASVVWTRGTVVTPAASLLIVTTAISAMVLGMRQMIAQLAIGAALLGALAIAETQGILVHQSTAPVWTAWLTISVFAAATGATVMYGRRLAQSALARARTEIAKREMLVASLYQSETRLSTLAALGADCYWETDAGHRFTRVDVGERYPPVWSPPALIGKCRWDLPYVYPDAAGWRAYREMLDAHRPFHDFELALAEPSGRLRWFAVSGKPMVGSGDEFLGYIGVSKQITAQREAEADIRRVAEAVAGQTGAGFFDSLVVRLCQVLGTDMAFAGRLIGSRVQTIAACADGQLVDDFSYELEGSPCESVPANNGFCMYPQGVAERFPRDEGLRLRRVEAYIGANLTDADGHRIGVLVTMARRPIEAAERIEPAFRIFAARASAELARLVRDAEIASLNRTLELRVKLRTEQLAEANRELEAFSYSVSHDLLTPLRHIGGYAQMLAEDHAAVLNHEGRLHLDRMCRAVRRMDALVNDLLALSRAGRSELICVPVDLSDMANEIAAQLRLRDPDRQVELHIEGGITALADAGLLRTAMENLMGNSWKFTAGREPAVIRIGMTREGGETVYFVVDNGVGFEMQYADKLFLPFERLHGQHAFEGSGIGLATVQRIVKRHGGRVWAFAEPGKGARFQFTLGAAEPGTAALPLSALAAARSVPR